MCRRRDFSNSSLGTTASSEERAVDRPFRGTWLGSVIRAGQRRFMPSPSSGATSRRDLKSFVWTVCPSAASRLWRTTARRGLLNTIEYDQREQAIACVSLTLAPATTEAPGIHVGRWTRRKRHVLAGCVNESCDPRNRGCVLPALSCLRTKRCVPLCRFRHMMFKRLGCPDRRLEA